MQGIAYIVFALAVCSVASASDQCEVIADSSVAASGTMLLQRTEVSSHQEAATARIAKADLHQASYHKTNSEARGTSESLEDLMLSEGVQGVKAWTVDDVAGSSSEKRHVAPHVSLMMAHGSRNHRTIEKSQSVEDVDATSDEEHQEIGKKRRKQKFNDVSVDMRADEALKIKRKKTSLAALSEIMEADRQTLDEEGYSAVASTVSNRMMERFIERLIDDLDLEVVDTGGLKGLVPYYSGQKDIQTFDALQEELVNTADTPDSWLAKKHQRPQQNNLLQVGAAVGSAEARRKRSDESVSFLEQASSTVRRSAHKVPDLMSYYFGSQTVVMFCMVGFIGALFFLHEHNEKKRVAKGYLFEDPLNMSPTPPAMKEDHLLAANLKALRAQKTIQ